MYYIYNLMDNLNTDNISEDQEIKFRDVKLDFSSIIKLLIIIWNIILLYWIINDYKNGDIRFYLVLFWIPILSILGIFVPNTRLKKIVGWILTISGRLLVFLLLLYIIFFILYLELWICHSINFCIYNSFSIISNCFTNWNIHSSPRYNSF